MQTRTIRIWQALVILLVICNIALIAVIWCRPGCGQKPAEVRPGHPEDVKEFIIHELQFSQQQKDAYLAMVRQHHEAMQQLEHSNRELKRQLFDNLKDSIKAGNAPDSLAQLIAGNEKQKQLITFRHFSNVRTLCNDKQKATFDNIIQDAIAQILAPRGNGMDGRPGHRPPPPGGEDMPPPAPPQGEPR